MKYILALATFLVLTTSCAYYYSTSIQSVKSYPPIEDDSKILIFDEKKHSLPDSAEYIGTLELNDYVLVATTSFLAAGASMYLFEDKGVGIPVGAGAALLSIGVNKLIFDSDAKESVEDAVKESGGNLLLVSRIGKSGSDKILSIEGKVYKVPINTAKSSYSKASLIDKWKNSKADKLEGFYAYYLDETYKKAEYEDVLHYAIVKEENQYKIIYIQGFDDLSSNEYTLFEDTWEEGDVVGVLNATNRPTTFTGTVSDFNKSPNSNTMAKYDQGNLYVNTTRDIFKLTKVYPEKAEYKQLKGSLTGFAINNNRLMTCFHGVSDLEMNPDYKMFVTGINGNFDEKHQVVIDKTDRANDIAVLRLLDTNIKFDVKPYSPLQSELGISKEVFVLGYPLSRYMGEEIKLANGIVSSLTGYAGNKDNYQITAPIQPGNSGSPAFDGNGNFIGMITSTVNNTDNVAYTLKYNTLKHFLEKHKYVLYSDELDAVRNLNLTEKVKHFKNNIFLIEMVNTLRKE